MARPLLCVAALALAFVLATAGSAKAELTTLVFTGTNPVSPGASLTPRIKGEIEQVVIKAVPFGVGPRAAGPITRADGPGNTVRLYTDSLCAGPVAGQGTVAEFKDEGILVNSPVAADAVTTFYATQSDAFETSDCSPNGIAYRQVTTPPEMPILDASLPPSPANENTPRLRGSADPEATISIFTEPGCTGGAVASGLGSQLAGAGIQVTVPDNSETSFYARAAIAGFLSSCNDEPFFYTESTPPPPADPGGGSGGGSTGGGVSPAVPTSPPPPPRLRVSPGGWANDNTPLLSGTAPGASTVRIYADPECGGSPVVKASAAQFEAGVEVRVLDNVVAVFSADAANISKTSTCSQPVVYGEDSLVPHTRITMGPAAKTAKRKAIFRFMDTTGDAPGTRFLCRVDRRAWKQCVSPLRLRNLKPRRYTVRVKATDPAGNVETKGAKRRFKVVAHP